MKDIFKQCIYQIYPKSFYSSCGKATGDIKGITQKLDYLSLLGVDYIWITPIFLSPQNDNGYDVADYYQIDPAYGTMQDVDELIQKAKEKQIGIMFDMVFNHTSTNHVWFQKAIQGDPEYMDYYIFKDPVDGGEPTNWQSKFGGSSWEYVEHLDKYYLHLFDKTQADLNWKNENVRKALHAVLDFWLEKGIKGFRFDVINLISKPDVYRNDDFGDGKSMYTDGKRIHEFLKEMHEETFGKYEDIVTVGEMSATSIDYCIQYTNPQSHELDTVFNFHHLKVDYQDNQKWSLKPYDFDMIMQLFETWQTRIDQGGGVNALFWCNHDQPRVVSRFGDDQIYREESVKMLATAMHFMKGMPYIYQGEELGMSNAGFTTIEEYRDVESINYFHMHPELSDTEKYKILKAKSRDNARTPMQWDASIYGGFSTAKPWIDVCKNKNYINVEKAIAKKDSTFYYYQKLIQLRKEYDVMAYGTYHILKNQENMVYAYERTYENEVLYVVCNFSAESRLYEHREEYALLLGNYNSIAYKKGMLRPYEALVFYRKDDEL